MSGIDRCPAYAKARADFRQTVFHKTKNACRAHFFDKRCANTTSQREAIALVRSRANPDESCLSARLARPQQNRQAETGRSPVFCYRRRGWLLIIMPHKRSTFAAFAMLSAG